MLATRYAHMPLLHSAIADPSVMLYSLLYAVTSLSLHHFLQQVLF